MKNKVYSKEIIEKYLRRVAVSSLVIEYELSDKKRIYDWCKIYQSGNKTFEDGRGKSSIKDGVSKGRPKSTKKTDKITKEEYIAHLEMENDILKHLVDLVRK